MCSAMLTAHRDEETNHDQPLDEHLFHVADYCEKIGKHIDLPIFMYLIGLLHDVGKADKKFQDYIKKIKKGRVNHSSAGGKYVHEVLLNYSALPMNQDMCEVMEYVIYAHHGLFDVFHEETSSNVMKRRLEYDKEGNYSYHEEVLPFIEELDRKIFEKTNKNLKTLHKEALEEFTAVMKKLKDLAKKSDKPDDAFYYYMHAMVRLSLSILKEGDIYDSATVFDKNPVQRITDDEKTQLWTDGLDKVESLAAEFSKSKNNTLNANRTSLSNQLKEAGKQNKQGIFKLEMPTGSGKTYASLRYAMNNAHTFNKQRVFYITAFLSVLEQNAKAIKETLDDTDYILEHHSNVIQEKEEKADDELNKQQYFIDSWDSPIVLTTMVQFFQTLFKGKASHIRRFHQLIDSVVIIDEVQSLPIKVIYHFNLMMNFMSEVMKTNIVLCTATQPTFDLDTMDYPILYADNRNQSSDLAVLTDQMKVDFTRIKAVNLAEDENDYLSTEELAQQIQDDLENYNSILVILNTKNAVKQLYDYLKENTTTEVVYLTTNLCAAHRLDKINDIHEKLESKDAPTKLIVVSTQLVEAGVDFDFNVVYRSIAGVDSLIQAAGRCNRNGYLDFGLVKVFHYEEENLKNLPEIAAAREASSYALRKAKINQRNQIFDLEDLQKIYYKKYFTNQTDSMGYNKNDYQLLDLLGRNPNARGTHRYINRNKKLAQSFAKAAREFDLIDQETTTIIVPYVSKDNKINTLKEIEALYQAIDDYNFKEVNRITKLLQPYTIQVYDKYKLRDYMVTLNDDSIHLLIEEHYDNTIGLTIDTLQSLIF